MRLESALQDTMLAVIPDLRAFAVGLCHRADWADDLVQEALLRAIAKIDSFEPGTSMRGWLFTILRNHFFNELRRRRREVCDPDNHFGSTMTSQPEQDGRIQLADLWAALARLPEEQREAVLLIGADGLSCEEAAEICHCAVGTIKSRANRARTRLAALLSIEDRRDLGPDRTIHAALSSGSLRWAA